MEQPEQDGWMGASCHEPCSPRLIALERKQLSPWTYWAGPPSEIRAVVRAYLYARLTFSHNFLFKYQKKNRKKVESPNERLPARTGRRTSPATRFSSPVVHHLCAPGSRPGGQWSANTAGWSTGQPAHGPGGPRSAPGQLAALAGLAAQAPGGPLHAVATAAPPQAKA